MALRRRHEVPIGSEPAVQPEAPEVPQPVGPQRPPPMLDGKSCASCYFFDATGGGGRSMRGFCRRQPLGGVMGSFPMVTRVDWCGEYRER